MGFYAFLYKRTLQLFCLSGIVSGIFYQPIYLFCFIFFFDLLLRGGKEKKKFFAVLNAKFQILPKFFYPPPFLSASFLYCRVNIIFDVKSMSNPLLCCLRAFLFFDFLLCHLNTFLVVTQFFRE